MLWYLTGRQRRLRIYGTYSVSYTFDVRTDYCHCETVTDNTGPHYAHVTNNFIYVRAQVSSGFAQAGRAELSYPRTDGNDYPFQPYWGTLDANNTRPYITLAVKTNTILCPLYGDSRDNSLSVGPGTFQWLDPANNVLLSYTLAPEPPNYVENPNAWTTVTLNDSGPYEIWCDVEEAFSPSSNTFKEFARPGGTYGISVKGVQNTLVDPRTSYPRSGTIPASRQIQDFMDSIYDLFSDGQGTGTVSATWEGGDVSYTVPSAAGGTTSDKDMFSNYALVPRACNVTVKLLHENTPSPDSVDVVVRVGTDLTAAGASSTTTLSGAGTITWTKFDESYFVCRANFRSAGSNVLTASRNVISQNSGYMPGAGYVQPKQYKQLKWGSTTYNREGILSTDYLFEGWKYPIASIALAASRNLTGNTGGATGSTLPPVNNSSVIGWTSSDPISYVTVDGKQVLQCVSKGNTLRFDLTQYLEHRYLRCRIRSVGSANKPFRIDLITGGYTGNDANYNELYNGTTGADGEWKEVTFDRVSEMKRLAIVDGHAGYTDRLPKGSLQTFFFENLTSGVTYQIEYLRGELQNRATVRTLGSTLDTMLKGMADGMPTMRPALGIGNTPAPLTLPAWAPAHAWTVTPLRVPVANKTPDSTSANSNVFAPISEYLDSLCPNVALTAIDLTEVPASGLTLYGTAWLADLTFQPAAGDVFGRGDGKFALSTDITIAEGTRTALWGTVFGGSSPDVVLSEGSRAAGRGGQGLDGGYKTGTPWAMGGTQARAKLDYNPVKDGYDALISLGLWWRAWFVTASGHGLSTDTSPTGLTVYADSDQALLRIFASMDWQTTQWQAVNAGIAGETPCIRFERGGFGLWLVSRSSSGGIERRYSNDGGRTWTMPVTVNASGKYPCLAISPTGLQLSGWRTDAGAVQVKAMDNRGQTLFGPVTAVASGVADDVLALTWDASAQRWYLLYRETGGAVRTVNSTDGQTWS